MFANNWLLALCAIAASLLGMVLMLVVMRFSQRYFVKQQAALGDVNGHVEEMYSGHTVVKAFGGEADAKTHAPLDRRDLAVIAHAEQWLLGRFVGELRFVEEREHALGAGRAALQVLERLRELRKRLREEADVQHERHDDAEFDAPAHREPRADDTHDDIPEVTDEVHHRHHQAGKELALPPRLVQVVVVALEPADRVRLTAERLDDLRACQVRVRRRPHDHP